MSVVSIASRSKAAARHGISTKSAARAASETLGLTLALGDWLGETLGHAEFHRQDKGFETRTEIVVSPEDDIEIRRVRITNKSGTRKVIEVTSYAEVVLSSDAADAIHPAFNKLFVQTEIVPGYPAIICTRRPRSADEHPPWMFHLMTVQGVKEDAISFETDRMKFIGRGNTLVNPQAMNASVKLSGSQGPVLDPIVSIRYRIVLKPEQTTTIDLILGIGETREVCQGLMEKYQDRHLRNRAFELSWTHSQVVLRQINATEAEAQLYERIAGSIIYPNSSLRADASILIKNFKGQSGLWSYSISGDLPIVLLRIEDSENIALVKQLVQAHAYWQLKGLAVDLVIWNEDHRGYRQTLQDEILGLISANVNLTNKAGSIFVKFSDQISHEDKILFQSVARIIISDSNGALLDQINKRNVIKTPPPLLSIQEHIETSAAEISVLPEDLLFFNGHGGYSQNGREYVIITTNTVKTPAPWVNVIANPHFGTVISESGSSYTWVENAHELRLSPWCNDPVSDTSGEAFYIRDEESGVFWSPMPLPASGETPYITRHGFGYSVFEHTENGIRSETWVYADIEASIKFITIKFQNLSGRSRQLSATGYITLVLGDLRHRSAMHIITDLDPSTGALVARNQYNNALDGRVVFFDVDDADRTFTADRNTFIGRNGTLKNPDAMSRVRLSGKIGAGLDPCAAIQVAFNLNDGQEHELVFRLGVGRNATDATQLIRQFRGGIAAGDALKKVQNFWIQTIEAVQIETPDVPLNILANGWLTYQTLSSRIWGRSGYYQSGGAFGFRDQLQDVLSFLYTQSQLARNQILLCASRQFKEGDVQHWWHPPSGRGIRTKCSDDLLWLPFVTCQYVTVTGDSEILNEPIFFLDGRPLNTDEESYYDLPDRSGKSSSLYDHCVRAIKHSLSFGIHGLPLMGSGDWNDGMDKVGKDGKGESIWLGFFLYNILIRFIEISNLFNDTSFAEQCRENANELQRNIEQHGWDGEWYRRAYFDDGTALGSSANAECRIDSISQSWSILSGAGDTKRSGMAMNAVDKHLVNRESGIIQLLDPPFDKSDMNPGYIKGYVPGVRENGGQYTHAAIWAIMAFAAIGDGKRAWELFDMINPVNHGRSMEGIATYKVEPYVVAADVYASPLHNGQGGWTWYTGSAGWMNQLIFQSLLGLKAENDKLRFEPCLPAAWSLCKIHYRYKETLYHFHIHQVHEEGKGIKIKIDGMDLEEKFITLIDDHKEHTAEILISIGNV